MPDHPSLGTPRRRLLATFFLAISAMVIQLGVSQSAIAQSVPTFKEVNGFEIGERLVRHRDARDYLNALAETSDRVSVETIGMSWEGRELMLATVTSPANHSRLDEILAGNRALDDARTTTPERALELAAEHPVTVLFTATIHGFELSPTEGMMRLLERLTTESDSGTLAVLDNAVIAIQPIANPDGRDAFVNENHARIGRTPNPSRADWNNDYTSFEALRYRTTHYFFDPNRDWFANTQPETRAIAEAVRRLRPHVAVDVHEMGTDNSFYFDPPAKPYGLTPEYALTWYEKFGAAHAAAFDRAGFEYFGRDFYNYFYPGYSEAYNNLQGAVGMLYEQGAPRGLAIDRRDGSVLTMKDASLHQYTAAWAALELATGERQQLLSDYHASAQGGHRRDRRRRLCTASRLRPGPERRQPHRGAGGHPATPWRRSRTHV